jgi:hypothetical protein
MALASWSWEVASFVGDLRIDFEPDPAAGLLLCADEMLCGNLKPQVQAVREVDAAVPAVRRMLGPKPTLSIEIAPSAPQRVRSSIPIS